jgi:uracil-DNA glycosylase family 4
LPTKTEITRNREWFEIEVSLIQPVVIITLGKESTAALLEHYANRHIKQLGEVVGTPIDCNVAGREVQVVAVHHSSGAFQHPISREMYKRAAAHIRRILKD